MNEHPSDQSTGTWKRKILVEKTSRCRLVLHDHRGASVSRTSERITRADVAGATGDPINFLNHVQDYKHDDRDDEVYHMICHIRERENFATNPDNRDNPVPLFPGGTVGKRIVSLQTTTNESLDGEAEVLEVAGNSYVWLPMNSRIAYRKVDDWLPQFMSMDFETGKKIVQIVNSGDRSNASEFELAYGHLLNIILPIRAENRFAFNLLCEAAKAVDEENTKRTALSRQASDTAEFSGVLIHAPKGLSAWLAPFGKTKTDEIPVVARMVGSGEVKIKAEEVLNAVKDNSDPQKAIQAFLRLNEPKNL